MSTSKKTTPKKAAATKKATEPKKELVKFNAGDKITPVVEELHNGKPVVFEVDRVEGDLIYIKPDGINYFEKSKVKKVDIETPVNF